MPSRFLEAGEGFIGGREDFENPMQPGQFEHGFDLRLQAAQFEVAVAGAGIFETGNQSAETRGIDEPDFLEVDYDINLAFLEKIEHLSFEVAAVVGIKPFLFDFNEHCRPFFLNPDDHSQLLFTYFPAL
jgi:hypothetical protein